MSTTATDTPAIELRDLRKVFNSKGGKVVAVNGLNLSVNPGEVVAFLGPNGAGKTTTLDMVLGLSEPTGGTARVLGQEPRQAVHAGRVTAVLQSGGLLDDLTVAETVKLVASFYRRHEPVDEVIERAGLTGLHDRRVLKCSGGEQQRLRFALALLPSPELLILDEPTAGMDVTARHEFWDTMHAEARAGRTVVFATHYLEEAEDFAERIVMVVKGRVIADGTTDELRSMTSARQVSVDLDSARVDTVRQALMQAPGVRSIQTVAQNPQATRLQIRCTNSDAIARLVLDAGGSELEISRGSLDETFIQLTNQSLSQEATR